jgi:2-methylcitrate dehydratase PrpD
MELLLKHRPINVAQVREVTVRLANTEAAIVNNREMPDVNLQHMIAVMLVDKTVTFRTVHDKPRMSDAAILAARQKVRLIPDAQLESKLPLRIAIVEITFNDGTKLSQRIDAVRGSAENPMPREEVVAKSRDLISPVLGAETCAKLIEKILNLEKVKNIRELRPLLQRA